MIKTIIITEQQANKHMLEAKTSKHFKERLKLRLNSLDLPTKDIIRINQELKNINRNSFDKKKSYGIRIIRFNPNPKSSAYVKIQGKPYYTIIDEFGKDSTGNELWAIVRENEMKTFFLRKSVQTSDPSRTKNKLRVDEIFY